MRSKICNPNWDKNIWGFIMKFQTCKTIWQQEIDWDQSWKSWDLVTDWSDPLWDLMTEEPQYLLTALSYHTIWMTESLAPTQSDSSHYLERQWDPRDLIRFICYRISIVTWCLSAFHQTIAWLIKCQFVMLASRKKKSERYSTHESSTRWVAFGGGGGRVGMLRGRGVNVSRMHCTNMVRQLSELIA